MEVVSFSRNGVEKLEDTMRVGCSCTLVCGAAPLLSLFSLFLNLSGRRPDIDWNTVSKGR